MDVFKAREQGVDEAFQQSALSHLQLLAENSQTLNEIQKGREKHSEVVNHLKRKLERLETERNELRKEYQAATAINVRELLTKSAAELGESLAASGATRVDLTDEIADKLITTAQTKRTARRDNELRVAYRLAGRTLTRIDNHRLGVRFETSFQGKYYESYYVILALDADKDELRVFKHTLPYHVPLVDLARQYLALANLNHFLDSVGGYLNAFVSRREQCRLLKAAHPNAIEKIEATQSYDALKVTTRARNSVTMHIYMAYDDMARDLPQRVEIFKIDGKTKRERPLFVHTATFKADYLDRSFTLAYDDLLNA